VIAIDSFMKLFQQSFYDLRIYTQQVWAQIGALVQFVFLGEPISWGLLLNLFSFYSVFEKCSIFYE